MPNHAEFIHLHTHSAYSLAEGALRTKEIVELCVADKMPAVAITDTNNLFGALEFATAASAKGVQSILGCQLAIGEDRKQLVFLVQNDIGYKNLSKLVSDAYMLGEDTSEVFANFDALQDCSEGIICLSGGTLSGFREEKDLLKLKEIYGDRFYIELQRHGMREEEAHEEALINIAYEHNIPLVAANDCYFKDATMHEAHDALLCIAGGRYITEEDRRRVTKEHSFKSPKEMIELFSDIPEAIQNTVVIAQRCSYLLKHIDPILPPFTEEGGEAEYLELERQAKEGLKWRVENYAQDEDPQPYFDKMDYELGIIKEMGFPGYFLIVSDFIKWAKDQDIPVGPGRGSGAGSVVAWALKITDLDPLKLGLLFERFLNPERLSMPDFDIDFCQDRRGEVINYVQEKYGRDRVAQIITFGKLQARAVVRDVGRVLQMPYFAVDRISKMIPNNPAQPTTLQEALDADADFRLEVDKDETSRKLIDIALKLEGLFRHASTHAAGLVIGDRPLHELVPLYRDPRSDMPVTQFNMKYVESAGLVKFDFLGLKTLTVVQMAVKFIKETTGKEYDMLALPLDDKASYDLMASGVSTGVFQLESTGMKDILRKMKPSQFEEIIALVSLYRPGPMDNIPTYISNKNGDTEPDYMHPKLKPILETTYGILIYQEQVLQAAQILAGYTLGGADFLRKAMGKKIKEEMDKQREKFMTGAAEHNDVPSEQASAIFDQIAKFAGYGFNRAHASCYALIAYQTAWLKANYPHEFMAASMTLDAGNTDKLSIFKQELDRMKIPLLQPDINRSDVMFRVEEFEGKKSVRYALAALKGVGEAAMEKIVTEREESGKYKDITDFINRLDPKAMNKRQFEGLVSAGAFECLHKNRAEVHGNIEMLLKTAQANAAERESGQESLFGGGGEGGVADLPPLAVIEPWDNLETLRYEFDAVGFYLSAHPLDSREDQLNKLGITSTVDVPKALSRKPSNRLSMAGILIRKQERVSAKSGNKFAFLQLSDSTGVYEVMIFSDTLARCREILVPGTALMVDVDAEMRDEEIRYSGQRIQPLDEALAGKLRNLTIHIDATEPVQKIHDAIKGGGQGLVQVTLHAYMPNGEVAEIDLKGKHNIPPELLSDLQKTAGFLKMQES